MKNGQVERKFTDMDDDEMYGVNKQAAVLKLAVIMKRLELCTIKYHFKVL